MKKFTALLISVIVILSFASCKKTEQTEIKVTTATDGTVAETQETTTLLREREAFTLKDVAADEILIAYFDGGYGAKKTAEYIKDLLGCESFEIKPVEEYPEDEAQKLERADNEYENLILPALEGSVENMSKYSVLIVVFPEFNGNMPMAVRTFLEDYDLRRIAVVPVILTKEDTESFAASQISLLLSSSPVYEAVKLDVDEFDETAINALLTKELE